MQVIPIRRPKREKGCREALLLEQTQLVGVWILGGKEHYARVRDRDHLGELGKEMQRLTGLHDTISQVSPKNKHLNLHFKNTACGAPG